MHTSKNYKRTFVAKDCIRTVGITAANLMTKLAPGEVMFVNTKGAIVNTAALATAAEGIRLVMGTNQGSPILSDIINKKELSSVLSSKFRQKQERKVVIGNNGVSGTVEIIPGNVYSIEIDHIFKGTYLRDGFNIRASHEAKLFNETQFSIVQNLAQLIALDYSLYDDGLRVNLLTSVAGVAGATGAEVITGNKTVTYTAGTPPTVGNIIKIPGVTGSWHRNEDATAYLVTSVDTVNRFIELDRPYQNRSAAGLATTNIVNDGTQSFGISFEGVYTKPLNCSSAYYLTDFDVRTFGFGSTTVHSGTVALAIDSGFGRYEAVCNSEFAFTGGEGGNIYQSPEFRRQVHIAEEDNGYSCVTISFGNLSTPTSLETHANPKEIQVFLQRGNYEDIADNVASTEFSTNIKTGTGLSTVNADSFLNVLNAFAVSAGVLLVGANTVSNGGREITSGTVFNSGIDV